ncbi:MAG: hypothetical protein HY392_01370 [Candidatus Diapherotrites archaeon]|nr:hypothetical protein [Candidatus Diapherotrites archaeon]
MNFDAKKLLFVLLFGALVFLGSQVNFSRLVGADNQFFTLFQFFGPIAGTFLGPALGALSVILAQGATFVLSGREFELLNVLRLAPMVFAAYYFGTSSKKDWGLIVPVLAIAAFVAHPVAGKVWFYSLFWTIPIISRVFFAKNLFFKSLGATFTAHAVGGAIWAYTVPMTPEMWIALIPVVIFERTLFAAGIAASYVAMNTLLARVENLIPQNVLSIDKKYDIARLLG